ncbi:MAG TPA: hypothetical protein VMY37_03145 [Thermoguttaceae bacterium]|nr:hypothetical protein [Thermoguttaceae bacterium]
MRRMTILNRNMSRPAAFCALTVAMMYWPVPATAEVVIQAERAATRTEGGPMPGGRWNLWTGGSVGQPVRIAARDLPARGAGPGQSGGL